MNAQATSVPQSVASLWKRGASLRKQGKTIRKAANARLDDKVIPPSVSDIEKAMRRAELWEHGGDAIEAVVSFVQLMQIDDETRAELCNRIDLAITAVTAIRKKERS